MSSPAEDEPGVSGVTVPLPPQVDAAAGPPARLLSLGEPGAAVCEGDACYLPDPQSV